MKDVYQSKTRAAKKSDSREVKISVVVPLYNEEESLPELYRQLSRVFDKLKAPAEFLFIDDGSTDGSMAVLSELHKQDSRVRVFQFRRNYGKSAALAQGFKEARGEL
ncbi:MAG: glycosyltransferase, partial [Calditrichaeota bacterium]